jgi:AraC-like DNA-binding protein
MEAAGADADHREYDIPAFVLRAIATGARAVGVDVGPILRSVGLTPEVLDKRRHRVAGSVEEALWRALFLRHPNIAAMGALGALRSKRGAFDIIEYAARTAATIGDALELLVRHSAFIHGVPIFTLDRRPQSVHLHYHLPHDAAQPFAAAAAELALGAVVRILREASGAFRPQAVELLHGPTEHDLEELFGVRVRYRQRRYAVTIAPEHAALPLREADAALHDILVDQLEDEAKAYQPEIVFVDKVRRTIEARLLIGAPTLADVADQFKMAPRTLQARLEAQGTSFREVVAEARLARAKLYLSATNMSIASVAALAGYSDERSLYRAFRRNLDTTPDAIRRASKKKVIAAAGG